MAWYSPYTWYETAVDAAGSAYDYAQQSVSGLFVGGSRQVNPLENGGGYVGVFEPSLAQEVIDYDPSEPYKDRPGNHGCPPGYYTSYDSGGRVCRRYGYQGGKLVGYDATESERQAQSILGNISQFFGSATETLTAPVRAIRDGAVAVGNAISSGVPWLKGSYVIIGILLAVALVLLLGSRLLSKVERGGG